VIAMHAFVTVGTTRFDALVALVACERFLEVLVACGFSSLTIQHGRGPSPTIASTASIPVEVECYSLKPSLKDDLERADLVIGHAGAGTVLEVLRKGKPLVVVPNSTLMGNHQLELAEALASRGHVQRSTVDRLTEVLERGDWKSLVPYPAADATAFPKFLDGVVGFEEKKE
jgi:beta-1,4-N-acetylglucosaminyltransferase